MVTVATVLRKTPPDLIQAYFASINVELDGIDWRKPGKGFAQSLVSAVDALEPETHARTVGGSERVAAMADEAGTAALYSVAPSTLAEELEKQKNGFARAMWLLVEHPRLFERAEEARYTDERRRGRRWDGFVGEPDAAVRRDQEAIEAFRQGIVATFGSKNVHVEIFDRHREMADGKVITLVQATVYTEGRPQEYLAFVDGAGLATQARRPVIEACVTYESATGVIETVAADRQAREDYARLFSRALLDADFADEHVQLRRFTLDKLMKRHAFPTDPEDGIESVRINTIRLMPLSTTTERVTLECMSGGKRDIWATASEHFALGNPLLGGWTVTQARLSIRFHPEAGSNRCKVLSVTISAPHGCDLKDQTSRERLVGEKYLRRWQLVEAV